MLHRISRSCFCAIGIAGIAVIFGACGSDQDPALNAQPTTTTSPGGSTTTTTLSPKVKVFSISVTGEKVDGGPQTLDVKVGDQVRIEVTSDTANEVHVHGYDLTGKVEPGTTTRIDLLADKPGQWEIELHEGDLLLATLKVSP